MNPQKRLQVIAELMAKCKPGSARWKKLQAELDEICGTNDPERSPNLEEAWERSRSPGGETE